jgi:hypothetical protein
MSVKLKKDLGLKDYLDLIAKQNEAIIDQLMIDPNAMTSAFRLTSHKQYKDSIKEYTIKAKVEEVKKDEWNGGDRVEVKSDDSNIGYAVIGVVFLLVLLVFMLSEAGII